MRKIFWFLLLGSLASCVTNKKVLFLQKDDVNKQDNPTDSLQRTYDIGDVQYKVQIEDLISVRIESLTPEEFDVYNRPGSSSSSAAQGGGQGGQGNYLLIGELVDHHGDIPFILSGKINVLGKTVYQIQDSLQQIANQYLRSPVVRVRLLNYRFTILGEVLKEGTITISNNRVSIIEAMGLAGGLTDLADRANIKLIRQHDGKAEVFYVNLLQEEFFKSPLYYTQQNDILIVPPLRQRAFRKYFTQNAAIFLSALSIVLVLITYTR